MQNELKVDVSETQAQALTSLPLAITFSMISYAVAFCVIFYADHGVIFSMRLFDHPAAFMQYLSGALGGSLMFPIAHVGIASLFKSKRNPSSRRNIFIGWSIATIAIQLISLTTGTPNL